MKAQTSIGTLPDAPSGAIVAATTIVAAAIGTYGTATPARDAWAETLQLLRSFEDDLGWDDLLVSTPKAVEVAGVIMKLGLPFIALNGVTGPDFTWLWLSRDALSHVTHNRPDLISHATKIEHGFYLSMREPVTARERVSEAFHILEEDARAAYWRERNARRTAI